MTELFVIPPLQYKAVVLLSQVLYDNGAARADRLYCYMFNVISRGFVISLGETRCRCLLGNNPTTPMISGGSGPFLVTVLSYKLDKRLVKLLVRLTLLTLRAFDQGLYVSVLAIRAG